MKKILLAAVFLTSAYVQSSQLVVGQNNQSEEEGQSSVPLAQIDQSFFNKLGVDTEPGQCIDRMLDEQPALYQSRGMSKDQLKNYLLAWLQLLEDQGYQIKY